MCNAQSRKRTSYVKQVVRKIHLKADRKLLKSQTNDTWNNTSIGEIKKKNPYYWKILANNLCKWITLKKSINQSINQSNNQSIDRQTRQPPSIRKRWIQKVCKIANWMKREMNLNSQQSFRVICILGWGKEQASVGKNLNRQNVSTNIRLLRTADDAYYSLHSTICVKLLSHIL